MTPTNTIVLLLVVVFLLSVALLVAGLILLAQRRATCIANAIGRLRKEPGASVEINCDDEEAWTKSRVGCVIVRGSWSGWNPVEFYGDNWGTAILSADIARLCVILAKQGAKP